MCNTLVLFLNINDISYNKHYINIPNGPKVRVTKMGRIKLHDILILEDVLYVPQFRFNLISVHKLCLLY